MVLCNNSYEFRRTFEANKMVVLSKFGEAFVKTKEIVIGKICNNCCFADYLRCASVIKCDCAPGEVFIPAFKTILKKRF